LISRLDIRYEGILYTVDSNEATIALSKVKSFGTEDRPTKHPVKPRDEVFEYIIFKAADIKDLVVCDDHEKQEDEMDGLLSDPAIVSVSKPPCKEESVKSSSPTVSRQRVSKQPEPVQYQQPEKDTARFQQQRPRPQHQQQQAESNRQPQQQHNNRPQHQSGFARQSGNRSYNRAVAPKEKLKFESDYDFVKANEQFKETLNVVASDFAEKVVFDADKEELSSDEEEVKPVDVLACYDKESSFFDSISCEALEKAEGKNTRPDWRKERQTNQQTFGVDSVRQYQHHQRNRMGPGGYRHMNNRYRQNQNPNNQRNSGWERNRDGNTRPAQRPANPERT